MKCQDLHLSAISIRTQRWVPLSFALQDGDVEFEPESEMEEEEESEEGMALTCSDYMQTLLCCCLPSKLWMYEDSRSYLSRSPCFCCASDSKFNMDSSQNGTAPLLAACLHRIGDDASNGWNMMQGAAKTKAW